MKSKKKKLEADLKFENEFLKAKIQMERGGIFHSEDNASTEVENQFLKGVVDFEKAWEKARQITVFEKIGRPIFKKASEISDAELKKQLNITCHKLAEKGIAIDSIHKVEEREMYRFITEELFTHEIDDMSLPGWVTHYTYEEFYPNHEFDVKDHAMDFVKEILGNKKVEEHLLCDEIKTSDGKIIFCEEALKKINSQRSFYSKFKIEKLKISLLEINNEKTIAKVNFDVKYSATIDGSKETQNFNGICNAVLKNEYECNWWTVYEFNMPGFVI